MSLYVSNPVLTVYADTVPTGMDSLSVLTANVHPNNITISWAELVDTSKNGGDVPIFYQVEWFCQPTSSYTYTNVNNPANY